MRLSNETEIHLVTSINTLSHWKIPLTSIVIKLLVKDYLDRSGVHDSRFKNNVPGDDWFKSFIKRNNLTQRLADNLKPAHAEIDALNVNLYFDELQHVVEDVPASHIYNYDETNVTEDPGSKTVVCQRDLKQKYNIPSPQQASCIVAVQMELLSHQWWFKKRRTAMLNGQLVARQAAFTMQQSLAGLTVDVLKDGS